MVFWLLLAVLFITDTYPLYKCTRADDELRTLFCHFCLVFDNWLIVALTSFFIDAANISALVTVTITEDFADGSKF